VLLDKIIDLATDADKPLSTLLRQCVVLAHELKNDSLKAWANQELKGYSEPERVPEYRIVHAGAMGRFRAGYMFPEITRPLPASILEEKHQRFAQIVYLAEPVSSYENNLKEAQSKPNARLVYQWSADMVAYYQSDFIEGHALHMAYQEVSLGAIAGLLDTIRTRVLNMALDIKTEIGESDADLKKVESNSEKAEKVNHIVINHIYGGTVFVGDQQNINTSNIAVGSWQDLSNALLTAGIQEKDIGELSQAIEQDGRTFGTRVKDWISRNATKVFDKGLQVGTSVGTTVLTEYIKRHFGM
jgi:AbiTii